MADYKSMYLKLFNEVTDAIALLQKAQQNAEQMYISSDHAVQYEEEPPQDWGGSCM